MRYVLGATGLALVLVALLVSSTGIEAAFHQPTGSLAWGPALFRALLALHGFLLVAIAVRRPTPAPRRERKPAGRRAWIALAAIMLIALGLRLWNLDSCLWLDEVLTMTGFARAPVHDILTRFPDQNQHMLYSLLAHGSMLLFGEHPWTLRLPSVLFGAGSIWALFLLARKMIGEREALLACALMAVSYHHVWFSQNARGYMGLLFFATLATWLWLEALDRDEWQLWTGYAVALFLGMWIHLTMVFVAAAHGVAFLVMRQWRWKPVAAWLLAATLTLQALALSLPEFLRSALHEASMNSEWTKPAWVVAEMVRSLRIGFSGSAAVMCAGALVFLGWWSLFRKNAAGALVMVLPAILGGAAMFALSHNIWPRFFFFCMGFVLIIVIHGAGRTAALVFRNPRIAARAGMAFAALFIVASAFTLPRCYALPKQDYTGARDYVESHRPAGSHAVSAGLAALVYKSYYAPQWDTAGSVADLDRLCKTDPGLILVYTLPYQLQAFDPALWNAIQRDFEVTKVFPGTLGGGEVFVGHLRPVLQSSIRGDHL